MDRRRFNGRRPTPLAERFWAKLAVAGEDECWLWQASTNIWGYGTIWGGLTDGTVLRAHRVSWEIHNGPVPDDLNVLHTCDVRACCNPKHLWLGTLLENSQDCTRKGRARRNPTRGSDSHMAKLDEGKVREIVNLLCAGQLTQLAIANRYRIDPSVISDIRCNRIWQHVPRRITRRRASCG